MSTATSLRMRSHDSRDQAILFGVAVTWSQSWEKISTPTRRRLAALPLALPSALLDLNRPDLPLDQICWIIRSCNVSRSPSHVSRLFIPMIKPYAHLVYSLKVAGSRCNTVSMIDVCALLPISASSGNAQTRGSRMERVNRTKPGGINSTRGSRAGDRQ